MAAFIDNITLDCFFYTDYYIYMAFIKNYNSVGRTSQNPEVGAISLDLVES